MRRRWLPAALALVTASACAPSAPPRQAQIDAVFAQYDHPDSPGCALGVVQHGLLAYGQGYGMANLEYHLPLTTRSVFRMASVSKQFTAAAVALLAEEGRISLDDDIRKYLPEMPDVGIPVTIRELLHHTSGVRDYLTLFSLAGYRDDDFYTDDEVVAMLARQKALNFVPGSEFLYSNSGYFLLSVLVKRVTGEPLSAYAQRTIFAPLQMTHSHYQDDHTRIVPERATGYSPRGDGTWRIDQTTLDMIGDGGVFTSIEDLVRWEGVFRAHALGGPDFAKTLLTPGVLTGGKTISYALGLELGAYRGLKIVEHGGSFVGFRTHILRVPAEDVSIAVLCNTSDAAPERLSRRVADVVLGDRFSEPVPADAAPPTPVTLPPEALARFAGAYRTEEGAVWAIVQKDGGLTLDRFSGTPTPLVPVSADELRPASGRGGAIVFDPASGDAPRASGHTGGDAPVPFTRVELVAPESVRPEDYVGTYASDELAVRMLVVRDGDRLFLRYEDPFKAAPKDALRPTLADTFAVDGLTVRFERVGRRRVVSFLLGAGRVRNLRFVRVAGEAVR